ncbi:hypothetical protein J6590_062321 [Homalodisca vitripennis]|nr:hypothetical protein J6590_062321 [Homalodisca vitripennis]
MRATGAIVFKAQVQGTRAVPTLDEEGQRRQPGPGWEDRPQDGAHLAAAPRAAATHTVTLEPGPARAPVSIPATARNIAYNSSH